MLCIRIRRTNPGLIIEAQIELPFPLEPASNRVFCDCRQVPTISLILFTHATLSHLGAYAHCCKHIPLFSQIPVYATTPIVSLGRTLLQDLYSSTPLAGSILSQTDLSDKSAASSAHTAQTNILLPPPTTEEIAGYFSIINPLKYSQIHQPEASPLSPPLEGLTITAYCAGHTLGGTIWHIQHGSESVVYALDWNQGRENVLPGAAWLGGSGTTGAEVIEQLRKPTALICSSKGAETVALAGGLRKRDDLLLTRIRETIQGGGSVLLPCDASARALEVAYMLERAWSTDAMVRPAKLYLASTTSTATMRYARSMLEWMDESVIREFEAAANQRDNNRDGQAQPFSFKHLKLLERKSQISRALASEGPRVFLATDASLEWGFAKTLVESFAANDKNLVILADHRRQTDEKSQKLTLVQALHDLVDAAEDEQSSPAGAEPLVHQCNNEEVEIREPQISAVSGDDLAIYQQYLARQRQRETTFGVEKATALETSADVVDDQSSNSSSSDEDDDTSHQGKALNVSTTLAHPKHKMVTLNDEDLGVNILLRKKDVHDYDVRGKRGREKIFPFIAKRRRNDDFGDLIRPEDFLRAEEREDIGGVGQELEGLLAKGENALGHKRRWDEKDQPLKDTRRHGANTNKRRRIQDVPTTASTQAAGTNQEEDEESEESDYEPSEPLIHGPTRVTFTSRKITLRMKITALDLSGLHDKRSLHMLIPLIRPRKLILTGGTKRETESLAEACRTMLLSNEVGTGKQSTAEDVLTPTIGMTVDASVDTNAWTIKLDRKLYKQLQWQEFRNMGVVTIKGRLIIPNQSAEADTEQEDMIAKRQKVDLTMSEAQSTLVTTKPTTSTPTTALLPILTDLSTRTSMTTSTSNAHAATTTQALHVGDLRLAELRRIMQAHGHSAEFKGEGTLLVDGIVAVRKNGIGRIEVEAGGIGNVGMEMGSMRNEKSGSFWDVKRKIYEGLAVVAAR